jgi:hypothetical protein
VKSLVKALFGCNSTGTLAKDDGEQAQSDASTIERASWRQAARFSKFSPASKRRGAAAACPDEVLNSLIVFRITDGS